MRIGSLFSGIGGLELGLERAGVGRAVWQVEQDEFCRAVLAKHWPDTDRSITDVRAASASNLARVDLICGGFPCQDVSSAGKRAGLEGERSGLWREYRRIVDELHPTFVVVENVASGARAWLCSVRSDLHELGYRTRALRIGACDVGAPHRRLRIFVIAMADADGAVASDVRTAARCGDADARWSGEGVADAAGSRRARWRGHGEDDARRSGSSNGGRDVSDAERIEQREQQGRIRGPGGAGEVLAKEDLCAAEPPLGRGHHGLPAGLVRWPAARGAEQEAWEPPRTAEGIIGRGAMLKALGNAVVPQCAELAGAVLLEWIAAAPKRAARTRREGP